MSDIQYRNTFPEKRKHNSSYRDRGEWRGKPRIILIVGEPKDIEPEPKIIETPSGLTKKCAGKCGQRLPIELFWVSRKSKDGHDSTCKICRSERREETDNGAAKCRPWQLRESASGETV